MKQQIITFSSFFFLLLSSSPALAVDNTPTPNPTKTYLQQQRREMQDKIRTNRIETREENLELRKLMITVTGTPKAEFRKEIKENNQELRQENKTLHQEFLSRLKINIITKIYNNAKNSLIKRYNYLVQTGEKIKAKLDEKAKAGVDVTAAKAKLTDTDAIVKSYTDHLAALETKFKEIIAADKPWTMISDFRKAEQLVRQDLQNLRQLQIDVLKLVVNK